MAGARVRNKFSPTSSGPNARNTNGRGGSASPLGPAAARGAKKREYASPSIFFSALPNCPRKVFAEKSRNFKAAKRNRSGYKSKVWALAAARISTLFYNRRMPFRLGIDYQPRGDQPAAIEALLRGLRDGDQHQVLLRVTGSGKTFTMAKVIEATNRPALVLAHNKTLAAQLYQEFKSYFPSNAVEYFVSYYDYYQPEAYIPAGDVYIEKEATVNEELDKLRLSATRSLFERRDCIIIASVSCIYGIGSPEAYYGMLMMLEKGQKIAREEITAHLVSILYERNEGDFKRGAFRVRGDVIELFPTYDD